MLGNIKKAVNSILMFNVEQYSDLQRYVVEPQGREIDMTYLAIHLNYTTPLKSS